MLYSARRFDTFAARGILKYCLRDMLGDQQQESLIVFMDAISALCAPPHSNASIQLLKEQVTLALARLERYFPLSLQVNRSEPITIHNSKAKDTQFQLGRLLTLLFVGSKQHASSAMIFITCP